MGLLDGLLKEVLGGAMAPGTADDRGRPGAGVVIAATAVWGRSWSGPRRR